MEVKRLFDLLPYRKQTNPQRPVFTYKENGEWKKHYIGEYISNANLISYGLLAMGVNKGENIALISAGRPEWNYVDMGVQQIGAVLVPIYPTISEDDYRFILNNAEVKYIIVETEALLHKIQHIQADLPLLKQIYTINPIENTPSLQDIINLGINNQDPDILQKIQDGITTDDIATIIYTSGTTGTPKGVMLPHKSILLNLFGIEESPLPHFTNALSWMPLCHIYERMMNYLYQYKGFETYYAENIGKVTENILDAKPHIMAAVPRFLEKVYDKIYRKGEKLTGFKRKVFFWALELGFRYDINEKKLSLWYKLQRKIADKLIYKTIRESLGGNLDMLVSGGASIQPRLTRFFSCVGLTLYEGYGLTECGPLVAVTNSHGGRKVGTVGFPLRGLEVRIDPETKEIQCKGGNVMKGYYKSPELTAEVIDSEGWFHTGDTGRFDEEGFLFLTGRTKSMFKTSMGKFVNPEVIEDKMKESPFILDMMVVGEGQKFAGAIIEPDFDFLKDWQMRHHITNCQTREEMISNPQTLARYQRVIDKYNATLGNTEQVKKFCLITDNWTDANRFLTPTLKIRRRVIANAYKSQIEELFK